MNAKQTADKMYTECSPISQIRGSVPSCIVSTSRNVYCVKGGALLCSASTSNPLSFSKAESTFYKDFTAYKTANNETGNEKKKLSLEEELLAERFRASTDVDVSGVQAVLEKNASTTVPVDDASEEKQWWLIVKRPGQTILWKERQEEGESTPYQLFDLFGQVLKSEMTKYKISAPMDLQVVACSSSPSSCSSSSTNWKFSFVSSGNVYFCSFSTTSSSFENALITPFTTTGISGKLEFGTPDFIMQEEFSRYSGVWWSPDKKSVAFSGCDIADTPQAQLLRPDGSVEEMPFPRVGQDNATCSIFVRSVINSENDDATVFKTLPLAAILATYPWVEYIVRLYWLSNSEMAVAVLSRDQERYALIKVPIQALLSLETSESLTTSPDMSLTPKANLLKEHNNNNNNNKESTSSPRWFEESTGNTKEESIKNRLQLLLTEMKHPSTSSSNDENNTKIVNQILSLSLSLSIIRESYIPEAWVDINDETHFFRHSTASASSSPTTTTTTIPSSQQQQQPLSIACVAQEINAATNDGFFHVFAHESNAFWRQVTSSSSLPRGILGAGTRIAKDKNGNCWLIARSFLNNAYLQTIVAIPLFSSAYEDEEKQAKICVLSSPTEDAIGFVVAQNQNSSSLIYHSLSIASSERRIQTQSVADLDSILANTYSGTQQNLNQKSQLVEFITVAVAPASTSTSSGPPAKTAGDIPIPKMNFFEVPIPGGPSTASVEKLQAMIMYPDSDQITNNNNNNKEQQQPLPLFVYTYGGPHVSFCTLTTICASTILECMRRLGFAVLLVDSRMATRHSLKVNSDGKRKMGSFEIRDVLSAVDFVVENQNNTSMFAYKIDPSRVGIHGFSYGGYVSLLALGQAGNRFKVSVAGAPVTDWRLYDTGYTERYMGLLPRDDKCYEDSSVWKLAANFPDEWNRCFILHGFLDENVHITHTQRLIQELIKEGKPFNLLAYPGERHGIRKTKESAKHSTMTTMRAFMEFL